jgi:hypothetical protein
VSIGADGLVNRVEAVFPPAAGRTPEAAKRRMLEFVRALKAEFGLSEVPQAWPDSPDGSLRLEVRREDGLGVVRGFLETRKEWGPSWSASLWRSALTGVDLRGARRPSRATAGPAVLPGGGDR